MVWSVVLMETHPLLTNRKPYLDDLLYKNEVFAIIGATIEVHNTLGNGFLEPVYQEALEYELYSRNIPYKSQVDIHINYKTHPLLKTYRADFFAYEKIIIEIKACDHLASIDEAQILNYLKATKNKLGILINFGASKLEWKRIIFDKVSKN